MLIAQITDIHIGFEPGNHEEFNRKRLDATIDALLALKRRPDMMLATGDLTDLGTEQSYEWLLEGLSRCPWPIYPIPGNHDVRETFLRAFPNTPTSDGFIQYEVEADELRIIMLDTLEEGRHGGSFCERRAAWLDARLSEQPNRPTMLVSHHPPTEIGIAWMSAASREPWVLRFAEVVQKHKQVVRLIAGHIHRPIFTSWAGTTLSVTPSTAPQVALDLRPINSTPDGRDMIIAEPPAYALHEWTDGMLLSHLGYANAGPVLARYNDAMQPLVEHLLAERVTV
jgi:3',5'-cyclic-AMP phosphodiesterase